MIAPCGTRTRVWTEAELEALPEDGFIHEVVNGDLVMSPKNNFQHEDICTRLLVALESFNRAHRLGKVLGSSAGFWMRDHNCRAPDVSFTTKARLLALGFTSSTRKFFPGAPDLAVEILSPNNVRTEMDARLNDFFASGTQIAWIIKPDQQCAEVWHSATRRKVLGPEAELDGEHLLPGFRFPLADLFKEWDWA